MYRIKGKGHWDLTKISPEYREWEEFHEEVTFYGDKKWDGYSSLVGFLWTNRIICGAIIADEVTIIDENEKELDTFVYNKEEKGYRSIEPAEWE